MGQTMGTDSNMTPSRDFRRGIACILLVLAGLLAIAFQNRAQTSVGQRAGRGLGTVDVKGLNEISGIAASRRHPGALWVHDDGGIDEVYAVDAASGDVLASISLGQEIDDCEDMALGRGPDGAGDYLYLGDIGDNDAQRDDIRILRFAEPTLRPGRRVDGRASEVQVLRLVYPDGKHDAEALFVAPETGDVYIVTKEDGRAGVYRASASVWGTDTPVELAHVLALGIEKVSAADISHDGQWIAFRREEVGWLWRRGEGQTIAAALRGSAARISVHGPLQDDNGEAVTFHPDARGYYTISEGKRQPIYLFPTP